MLSLLIIIPCSAQTYSLTKLDSITKKYKDEGNIEEAVQFNINALRHFDTQNNREGLVTAYINIGNLLCTLSKYKESLIYLDKAKGEINEVKNPKLLSRLYNEYGRNYALLGLSDQSNRNLDKGIDYAKKIPDLKQKNYQLYYSYAWKWFNFDKLHQIDSLNSMQRKSLQVSSEPIVFVKVAYKFIKNKTHLDSAKYYLDKASNSVDKYPVEQKGMTLMNYGIFYMIQGENEKALDYYLQSLAIYEKIKNTSEVRNLYSYIAYSYKQLNNTEKAAEYSEKHSELSERMRVESKEAINIAVDRLEKEKQEEQNQERKKLYFLIFSVITLSLVTIYFIRKAYVKKQKHTDKIIEVKSSETDELKKKINSSFEEVAHLAKANDPFFLVRFKEVYPEFYHNLISKHPSLSDHDIKFCAYIRLDLSTKEIVEFENISKRTVEAKKYRLKKKLELTPETDLKKWIMDL
ncbi:tetratricopeptide repeat protein [Chryseobacterium sp. MEBOG06]|uniref:tetratricopeptide repeat protein n=1 Tax=unclassified Chryseobacterium TaxID=2593645 RepID=UPI001F2EE7EF|nr:MULTISPECIES: tetratricopeptide repeat protein [unclassified Chryseobacterium]UKB86300.1 tetratricopeptide repeat protein [Chryseobacterium sp. MEBOG06]